MPGGYLFTHCAPIAAIVIGSPQWLIPAVCLLLLTLFFVVRSYREYVRTGESVLLVAGVLKSFVCLLCAALLLEPLWTGTRPKPGANVFLLLADNSQGMQIHDRSATQTRGELLKAVLTDEKANWNTRLQQDFQVRRYLFDQRLHRSDNFLDLDFSGSASQLGRCLDSIRERFGDRPVAGVLLFTDGNATDLQSISDLNLDGLPPMHPVIIGNEQPVPDIGIVNTTVRESGFEDAPVSVDVHVNAASYPGKQLVAELCKPDGTVVQTHRHEIAEEQQELKLQFRVRPENPGVSFYRLRVYESGKQNELQTGQGTVEATLANNQELLAIDRGKGPYRILYVAGRPNWEFKFLRRSIEEDQQLDLVALIRIAKREAKFDFRGRAGESANSLFRGFEGKIDEETERYDEPVLTRLNTRDDRELRDGFPKTKEQLYEYHAVILDDVESAFFTHDQLKLLHDFVADRGGSLMMLGGQETFHNGKYERTPVGDLLPVYLDRLPRASAGQGLRMTLTREGWLQPWVRLRDNEADEDKVRKQMPAFDTVNAVRGIKPGASILASATGPDGTQVPALVVQRFGHGKAAALTIGDMWRWGIRQEPEERDLGKVWRQTVRWLVTEVPEPVQLELGPGSQMAGETITLQVRAADNKFEPLDNAHVQLSIQTPGGEQIQMVATPSREQAGLYQAEFVPREPGAFRATATVTDADGKSVGSAETGWVANPAAKEFRRLQPNRQLMGQLAEATGGQMIELEDLESLVKDLPSRPVPVTERWASPLWHRPIILLIIAACLAAEWGLRRWHGLA